MNLLDQHCSPLPKGTPPLDRGEVDSLTESLSTRWQVIDNHHLIGTFEFPDFLRALSFANRAGGAAEAEGHHPEIRIGWGEAEVKIWTHSIDGLSRNDFILAARLDTLA